MRFVPALFILLAVSCTEPTDSDPGNNDNNTGKSDDPNGGDAGIISDDLSSLSFRPDEIPADSETLFLYLQSGAYESLERHPEKTDDPASFHGPSFVYFNDTLVDSFANGQGNHPKGAGAVKELFESLDAAEPSGWAVAVKIETPSGLEWWWYENNNTTTNAPKQAKTGGSCARCHSAGEDGIFTAFPFE